MAGLIDVGILKPELATSFATGYQQAQQARQRSALAEQQLAQEKQQFEMNQTKLEQLKQDRAAMIQLQDSLKSAGQDPNLNKVFDALIATGNPDYVMKGIDGKRRLAEQQRAESILRQFAPELFPAAPANALAPAAPTGAPSLNLPAGAQPPGDYTSTQAMGRVPGVVVTPIPESPPMNAMAPTTAPGAGADVNALRRQIMMLSSIDDPRAKAMAGLLKNQLTEMNKPHVVGGRLVTGAGKELYAAPNAPTELDKLLAARDALPAGDPRRAVYDAAIKKLSTHAPAPTTNVNVSTEKKYGERFGSLIADADAAKLSAAEGAPKAAATADRIMDILESGKVFTGTGANVRLQLAKALNLAGKTDEEKIANTEVLGAQLAETTLGAIKSSNLGAGQGFTNADREFLEKAKAGQITFEAESLKRLAKLSRQAAEQSAEAWNKRVKQIPASALEGTGITTEPVVVPKRGKKAEAATPAPAGVDPALWNVMTPQERALWQK